MAVTFLPFILEACDSGIEKSHKHKQIGEIIPGLGGWQTFVCAVFFLGGRGGGEKHINKIPRKSRDNPVRNLFMCFLFGGFLRSGTFRNPQPLVFLKSIPGTNGGRAVQIGGVLRPKESYSAVLRRFSFFQVLEVSKAQRYKWGAYGGTKWRCTAGTVQTSCTGWGLLNNAICGSG